MDSCLAREPSWVVTVPDIVNARSRRASYLTRVPNGAITGPEVEICPKFPGILSSLGA